MAAIRWSLAALRRRLLPLALASVALLIYRWSGLWPLERYPNWDWAWIDARSANSLSALRRNLGSGQLPGLDLRTNLGFDYVGDAYPIINPFNLLVAVLRPATVIWLRSAAVVVVGCCGAFYWFRRWATTSVAAVAALVYLTLPYMTSLHLFTSLETGPFVLPILLIAIEDLIDKVSFRNALRAWLAIAVSVLFGDINILLSLAPICLVYAGVYGTVVRGHDWRQVARAIGIASGLGLTAAAPLLIPLYVNSQSLVAGPTLASFLSKPRSTVGTWSFLSSNGAATLIWPFEGSGLLLYCPAIFVFLGFVGVLLPNSRISNELRRRSIAILCLAAALVIETLVVNNSALVRALGVAESGTRGILRIHLNLLPYLLFMVGVLGCARLMNQVALSRDRWPVAVLTCTIMASVAADLAVIWIHPEWYGQLLGIDKSAHVPSPTLLRLPRSWPPVVPLVVLHVLAALLVLVTSRSSESVKVRHPLVGRSVLAILAIVVTFGTVTANLELLSRSSQQWHWVTESTYRLDAFDDRRTCIERLARVNDPNVRVLYTGRESLSRGTGRDWANLMELELAQASGQHTLFSYRELDLPIVGVYNGFFGKLKSAALIFPPSVSSVETKASVLRLLGVRYVVSSNRRLTAAKAAKDFTLLGVCTTPPGPETIRGAVFDRFAFLSGAGTSYVYEVNRSPGIFTLQCKDEVVTQAAALSLSANALNPPWERGIVWTEERIGDANQTCTDGEARNRVRVLSENGSAVHLRVDGGASVELVASYAFRDGWSATLDGKEVPVVRAYGGLMAIAVPAGSHEIVLSYHSNSLPLGLAIFIVSGLALLSASWRSRRVGANESVIDLRESDAG